MNKMTTQEAEESDFHLDPRYVRRLTPDPSGGFTASIHEFPGCIAEGESADSAIENLERVAASWIQTSIATGYQISPPVDFEGASGKLALRISKRIHQQAAERAHLEGVSLNQLISVAIASYLGQQDGMVRCVSMMKEELHRNFYSPFVPSKQAGSVGAWTSIVNKDLDHTQPWVLMNSVKLGIGHGEDRIDI